MNTEDLRVGMRYQVRWDDCCVSGEFTAELTEVQRLSVADGTAVHAEDDGHPAGLRFDNGVLLTEWNAVEFAPAPAPPSPDPPSASDPHDAHRREFQRMRIDALALTAVLQGVPPTDLSARAALQTVRLARNAWIAGGGCRCVVVTRG